MFSINFNGILMNFDEFWWNLRQLVLVGIDEILKIFFTGSENSLRTCRNFKKLFFLKIFSRSKKWVKIAFFALWVMIFHQFCIDAARILTFWAEMGMYSTRKWRKNWKIRRYSRERAEAKIAIFKIFDLSENFFGGTVDVKHRGRGSGSVRASRKGRWGGSQQQQQQQQQQTFKIGEGRKVYSSRWRGVRARRAPWRCWKWSVLFAFLSFWIISK